MDESTANSLQGRRVVDLFSGCGGLSLGFEKAGFDVVAAFDNWEEAVEVYNDYFDHKAHVEDLGDLVRDEKYGKITKYAPDLIVGGPPCQDYSSANTHFSDGEPDPEDYQDRSSLTIDFAKIVLRSRPQWYLMENVPPSKKSPTYQKAMEMLQEAGYGVTLIQLNASYYGVPQSRRRLFQIGEFGGPNDGIRELLEHRPEERQLTIREYWKRQGWEPLDVDHHYRHPRTYSRRGVFSIDEPSPTIRGVHRPIPSTYERHHNDTGDPHSDNVRPLTSKERSYVQTFPKDFPLKGSKRDKDAMVGNAVPVKLAEHIAKCIKRYEAWRQENPESGALEAQLSMPLDG